MQPRVDEARRRPRRPDRAAREAHPPEAGRRVDGRQRHRGDAAAIGGDRRASELTLVEPDRRASRRSSGSQPIDAEWLQRVDAAAGALKHLKWRYTEGIDRPRPLAAWAWSTRTGCTSVWALDLSRSTRTRSRGRTTCSRTRPSMAMGMFEGPHGEDGRRLQGRSAWPKLELEGKYDAGEARRVLHLLQLAQVHRRRMAAVPAGGGGRRRRRDVRHRLPEPVARDDVGQADQGAGRRHAGLLEHRRPGLHLRLHRPDLRHGAVRQGAEGQGGDPQGDRPDRHGAPHHLRAAGQRSRNPAT